MKESVVFKKFKVPDLRVRNFSLQKPLLKNKNRLKQ